MPQEISKAKPIPLDGKYHLFYFLSFRNLTFGRLMMEKYDGIRVFWDGKQLHSKTSGKILNLPKGHNFPTIPFEGELW
jgi:hypothetical protein